MQNAINWFEIPSDDFTRAVDFYNTILDIKLKVSESGEAKMGYLPCDKGGVGGAIVKQPGHRPGPRGPMVYLNAGERLDDILSRVEKAGGRIISPKTLIAPEIGYVALFEDSEGNHIALHSPK